MSKDFNVRQQNNRKNHRGLLKTLNITAGLIIAFLGVLLVYLMTQPEPEINRKSPPNPQERFFKKGIVYYLNANLMMDGDQQDKPFDLMVEKIKNLNMEKQAVDNAFNKLKLDRLALNKKDSAQNFFYKVDEDTLYTFILYPAAEPKNKPQAVKIEIKITGGDDSTIMWGIYHLDREPVGGNAAKFMYTLKYIKGKYNKRNHQGSRSYMYLDINKTDQDINIILEELAKGIQKTINDNPIMASMNKDELIISFLDLSENKNQQDANPFESPVYLTKAKKTTWKGNRIDTFEMTDERRDLIKNDLKTSLEGIFSRIKHNEDDTQKNIEIYMNEHHTSKYSIADIDIAMRVFALLSDNGAKSYVNWKSKFYSKEGGVEFKDLVSYKEERLKMFLQPNGNSKKGNKPGVNATVVIILLVLILYGVMRYLLYRDSQGLVKTERVTSGEGGREESAQTSPKQVSMQTPVINSHETESVIENNAMETNLDTEELMEMETGIDEFEKKAFQEENEDDTSRQDKPGQYELFKAKIKKLSEIETSLYKLRLKALGDSMAIPYIETDKLKVVENILKKVTGSIEVDQGALDSKLNEVLETLKEFRGNIDADYLDEDLDKLEIELSELKGDDIHGREKAKIKPYSGGEHNFTIKERSEILENLKDLKTLKKFLNKIIGKIARSKKDEETIVDYIARIVTAPIETKKDVSTLKDKVEEISRQNKALLFKLISYIKKRTGIDIDEDNASDVIDKIDDEFTLSEEYRYIAEKLHNDMTGFERKYGNQWFWKLLSDSFLDKLKDNIEFFAINKKGETIYDLILGEETPLREIDNSHLKILIGEHHWAQIWDGVIRMDDFFNTYFDDDMKGIKTNLAYYSHKIREMLTQLGYKIKKYKPLDVISSDYRKTEEFEKIDKSYIENSILKNLIITDNKQLRNAVENIPAGYERIIFVERLGLTDEWTENSETVTNLRFGAYNQGVLLAHFSSRPRSVRSEIEVKPEEDLDIK
jgi:hypothetical protein